MRRITIVAATIVAAAGLGMPGCARTVPLAVETDHPAHPDAPAAPAEPPSQTLAITGAPPSGGATTMPGHEHPERSTRPAEPATDGRYVCPMHPEVTSDDPEARCGKCGMRLVPREEMP